MTRAKNTIIVCLIFGLFSCSNNLGLDKYLIEVMTSEAFNQKFESENYIVNGRVLTAEYLSIEQLKKTQKETINQLNYKKKRDEFKNSLIFNIEINNKHQNQPESTSKLAKIIRGLQYIELIGFDEEGDAVRKNPLTIKGQYLNQDKLIAQIIFSADKIDLNNRLKLDFDPITDFQNKSLNYPKQQRVNFELKL